MNPTLEAIKKELQGCLKISYSQYIPYMSYFNDRNDYEKYVSFANYLASNQKLEKITSSSSVFQNIIERQASQKWSQISELVSNAIDASIEGFEIGKFGIGFKQILQELRYQRKVYVITRAKDANYGRAIELSYGDGKIGIRDIKLRNTALPDVGTQVIVEGPLSTDEQTEIQTYLRQKYSACPYVSIECNGQILNEFKDVYDIQGNKTERFSEHKVDIRVTKNGYSVSDMGAGMSDSVFYENLLLPRQTTKKVVEGGENFYYVPRKEDEKGKKIWSTIKFVVSGVTIEEHALENLDLPREIIIHFPHAMSLSSARSNVYIDDNSLEALNTVLNAILGQEKIESAHKLTLVNSMVAILNILSSGTRASKDTLEKMGVIKNELKYKLLYKKILNPEKFYYLPNLLECQYFLMDSKKPVVYLSDSLYPENTIQLIPGIEPILSFQSYTHKAYGIAFKKQEGQERIPPYLIIGKTIILDNEIYKKYKKMPEALNLMINFWIGYGKKNNEIGRFNIQIEKNQQLLISEVESLSEISDEKTVVKTMEIKEEGSEENQQLYISNLKFLLDEIDGEIAGEKVIIKNIADNPEEAILFESEISKKIYHIEKDDFYFFDSKKKAIYKNNEIIMEDIGNKSIEFEAVNEDYVWISGKKENVQSGLYCLYNKKIETLIEDVSEVCFLGFLKEDGNDAIFCVFDKETLIIYQNKNVIYKHDKYMSLQGEDIIAIKHICKSISRPQKEWFLEKKEDIWDHSFFQKGFYFGGEKKENIENILTHKKSFLDMYFSLIVALEKEFFITPDANFPTATRDEKALFFVTNGTLYRKIFLSETKFSLGGIKSLSALEKTFFLNRIESAVELIKNCQESLHINEMLCFFQLSKKGEGLKKGGVIDKRYKSKVFNEVYAKERTFVKEYAKEKESLTNYLKSISTYGNAQLGELFFSPCAHIALRYMGFEGAFEYYSNKKYFSVDWFKSIYDINEAENKYRYFFQLLGVFTKKISCYDEFIALTERLKWICFNPFLDVQPFFKELLLQIDKNDLIGKISASSPQDKNKDKLNSFLFDKQLLLSSKQLCNYIEYFLMYGENILDEALEKGQIHFAMAFLGQKLALYHDGSGRFFKQLTSIKNKSDAWWKSYFSFFEVISVTLMQLFYQGIRDFHGITERWGVFYTFEEGENSLAHTFLECLKNNPIFVKYLFEEPPQDVILPEDMRLIFDFFRKDNIDDLFEQNIDLLKRKLPFFEFYRGKIQEVAKFSLAELAVYRQGENTGKYVTLKKIGEGIKKIKSEKQKSMQQNKLKSVIKSQKSVSWVWLRELIQNSQDVLNLEGMSYFKVRGGGENKKIDIEHSITKQQGKYWFAVSVSDPVGMDLYEVLNYFLSPESSNPDKKASQLTTGEFGMGVFSAYLDADEVELRTGKGDGFSYVFRMTVQRDKKNDPIDIQVDVKKFQDNYKGSTVTHIKRYDGSGAFRVYLESRALKNRINMLVGGVNTEVTTFKKGAEEKVSSSNSIMLTYNGIPLEPIKREMLAEVRVIDKKQQDIGSVKIYYESGRRCGKVEQKGLYVADVKPWIQGIPEAYQKILEDILPGLVIALPERAKLTASRDGVSQGQDELIRKAIWGAILQACLYRYLQRNKEIPLLPEDYYSDKTRETISEKFLNDAAVINDCLSGIKIGQWDNIPDMFSYNNDKENAIKLLTLIKFKGTTLREVITKQAMLDASSEIIDKINEEWLTKKSVKRVKNNDSSILSENNLTDYHRKLRDIVKELNKNAGGFFYDIVFYKEAEETLATAGSAKLDEKGKICWKLRLNAFHPLWENDSGVALIYTVNRDTFMETYVHEAAHTIEYESQLFKCLQLLDLLSLSEDLKSECILLIKKHFVSQFKTDDGIICQGEEQYLEDLKSILKNIPDQKNVIGRMLTFMSSGYEIKYNWTHNADETLETSFVNHMKFIMSQMLRDSSFEKLFIYLSGQQKIFTEQYENKQSPLLFKPSDIKLEVQGDKNTVEIKYRSPGD